jgi:hypothetical protein
VGASLLYSLLQDNVAHAAPATVVRELGKMALVGREAATGIQAAGTSAGAAAGLKLTMAAVGILATAAVVMITVNRSPSETGLSAPNEPNVTAAQASSDPNGVKTGRRMPAARHMSTPPPSAYTTE